eukprot:TRINITY_DN150_c0_g1_i2.p1 TRINITY_DN150_c0_g1~~TRINITY_DN150_c0_g1_i2.p1  ORF type:complete len:176 (-),score=23.77 TRINITY_DN150_c0_g1_i2:36-563(-)
MSDVAKKAKTSDDAEGQDDKIMRGQCFCGAVKLELTGKPDWFCLCHCTICQRLSGGEYQTFVAVRSHDRLKVVEGQDNLTSVASSEGMDRQFCKKCGSACLNIASTFEMRDAPIVLFERDEDGNLLVKGDPQTTSHIFYVNRVRNHIDNLPKFAAYPVNAAPLKIDEKGDIIAEE